MTTTTEEIKERVEAILKEIREGVPFEIFPQVSPTITEKPYYTIPLSVPNSGLILLYGCCLRLAPSVHYLPLKVAKFLYKERPSMFARLLILFNEMHPSAQNILYIPDFSLWTPVMQMSLVEQVQTHPSPFQVFAMAEQVKALDPVFKLKISGNTFYIGLPSPRKIIDKLKGALSGPVRDAPMSKWPDFTGFRMQDINAMIRSSKNVTERLLLENPKGFKYKWLGEKAPASLDEAIPNEETFTSSSTSPLFQAMSVYEGKGEKWFTYEDLLIRYNALMSSPSLSEEKEADSIPEEILLNLVKPPPLTMAIFRERVYAEQLSTATEPLLESYLKFAEEMGKKEDIRKVEEELKGRGVQLREAILPSSKSYTEIAAEENALESSAPVGDTAVSLIDEIYTYLNQGNVMFDYKLKTFFGNERLKDYLGQVLKALATWEEKVKLKFDIVPGEEGNPNADPVPLLQELDRIKSMIETLLEGYRAFYKYLVDQEKSTVDDVEVIEGVIMDVEAVLQSSIPQLRQYLLLQWNVTAEKENKQPPPTRPSSLFGEIQQRRKTRRRGEEVYNSLDSLSSKEEMELSPFAGEELGSGIEL